MAARLPLRISAIIHGHHSFPRLNSCYVERATLEQATEFLQSCHETPLQSFETTFTGDVPTSAVRDFYAVLTAGCQSTSLTHLTLDCYYHTWKDAATNLLDGETLGILFYFVNLTSVVITSYHGFLLDDETMFDLPCAWPRLQRLVLKSCTQFADPGPTLDALEFLARYCTRLMHLEMTFDACGDMRWSRKDAVNNSLTYLDVMLSPISAASPVAAFLGATFPNLRNILTQHRLYFGYYDSLKAISCWETVESLLPDARDLPSFAYR
ncbi:hypothetical protein C8R43DRAFT_316114 [Mycena crocata]|nr:hypothetical protein C8R43DRAFT_316114 [Mycena crocata]